MPKDMVIIGPPGTGKTSSAVGLAREWLLKGKAGPSQVAYLAFTKAAAKEASDRILKDEDIRLQTGDRLPLFRTIHSLAYMGVRETMKDDVRVITPPDMRRFSHWSSFEGAFAVQDWEDLSDAYQLLDNRGRTDWDKCLSAYSLSRISARSAEEMNAAQKRMSPLANMTIGYLEEEVYQAFVRKYEEFKEINGLIDFTDMLHFALTRMPPLDDVKYVMIDECLPAGTPVTMADGTTKPIEDVSLGDAVLGYDHPSGQLHPATVIETRSQKTRELISLDGKLKLTPNHPVYVLGKGYVRADDVRPGDRLIAYCLPDLWQEDLQEQECSSARTNNMLDEMRGEEKITRSKDHSDLCGMSINLQDAQVLSCQQEILLKDLHAKSEIQNSSSRLQGLRNRLYRDSEREESSAHDMQCEMQSANSTLPSNSGFIRESSGIKETLASFQMRSLWFQRDEGRTRHERRKASILQSQMCWLSKVYFEGIKKTVTLHGEEQSNEKPGYSRENERILTQDGPGTPHQRREWTGTDRAPTKAPGCLRSGMDPRAHDVDGTVRMEMDQAGSGASRTQIGRRVRRTFSQYIPSENHRSPQRKDPLSHGMAHNAVQEFANSSGSRMGLEVHTVRNIEKIQVACDVYNIGTETENYFASEILVHNCQDLAPVLTLIVRRLFPNAEQVWWAGDPNQAIFSFAAADAKIFIDIARNAHAKVTLRQTHRFGPEIVDISRQIISRARDRLDVDVIGAQGRKHEIRRTGQFQPQIGNMLLLHRHVAGCQALAQAYIQAGIPFRNERGKDPLGSQVRLRAYQAMRDLADGKEIPIGGVQRLVDDLMPSIIVNEQTGEKTRLVVHGAKKKLQDASTGNARIYDLIRDKILTPAGGELVIGKHYHMLKHSDDLEFYDRVIENGYDLDGDCPIITTMHASKGRQAEQVTVFNEMGRRCGGDDMDTEHRLAFVAATRTRGYLEICEERLVDWAEKAYEYPVQKYLKKIDTV